MQAKIFSSETYNQAYRYCLSLTHHEDDAFDLLQTSFEKFLKQKGKEMDNPKFYLFRIIRNQFIDLCRKNKTWKWNEYKEESNVALFEKQMFDDILVTKDEVEHLLSNTSPDDRELLYLTAVEEYSVREIAELQDTSRGTLLSKLHRLKAKIRQQLGGTKIGRIG